MSLEIFSQQRKLSLVSSRSHDIWAGNIAKSMTSEGNSALCTIRDCKIQQRVRRQERRLKSEFAFFQSL